MIYHIPSAIFIALLTNRMLDSSVAVKEDWIRDEGFSHVKQQHEILWA